MLFALQEFLKGKKRYVEAVIPFREGGLLTAIHKYGQMQEEEFKEDGAHIKAYVTEGLYYRILSGVYSGNRAEDKEEINS